MSRICVKTPYKLTSSKARDYVAYSISKSAQLEKGMVSVLFRGENLDVEIIKIEKSVHGKTEVIFDEEREDSFQYQLDELGSMDKEIEFLKQSMEYGLLQEAKFIQIRGVLLYGIAGTGKTHLMYGIAEYVKKIGVNVIELSPLDFASKQYGKNESRLSEIFVKARENSPTLIVCDEIDVCLCQNEQQRVEIGRLMRALGVELESIKGEKILFIATTNKIDKIPTSLRRPGRFDRELECQIPTNIQRLEIIQRICSSFDVPIPDDHLLSMQNKTHGFVGADLKTLCKLYSGLYKSGDLTKQSLQGILSKIKPSAIRHVQVEIPNVKWEDIGGMDYVKKELNECIEWSISHKETFEKMNIRPPRGILMYGPPGCGKTLMAKALATECNLNFLSVRGPEIFSKWVGESERAIKKLFERARIAAPVIIFFDEIDGLAVERGSGNSNVSDRVLSQLLSELDGFRTLNDVMLVAATNRPDMIDSALLRPGRIDRLVYVGPPDYPSRIKIIDVCLKKIQGFNLPTDHRESLAEMTEGYTGAEIVALMREASYIALNECLESAQEEVSVAWKHFVQAKKQVPSRLSPDLIQFYLNFKKRKIG